MKKALRISGIVLASLLGLILLILIALPFVLNSKVVTKLVDKYAAEYIDGDLEYSRLHVSLYKHFPRVGITLEDVAVTYPHERFAQYDTLASPLLEAGRGTPKDTLARFGTLDAAVNAWKLLFGDIRVHRLALDRFAAFGHHYGEAANWDIIRLPETEKTDHFDLPWIRLRELRISGRPHVVYTAQRDGVYAEAGFLEFLLSGNAKLSSEEIRLQDLHLALDSLHVVGQLPTDTLDARLEYLKIDEHGARQLFDLALAADALVSTVQLGRLSVPLRLDARAGYEQHPDRTDVELPRLDARIAQIPLHAEGNASLYEERIDLKAAAAITDCPLNDILRDYLDRYLQVSRDLTTDARLTVEVEADGTLSDTTVPKVEACVKIPASHSFYRPMDLAADLTVDLDAQLSPQKRLDAQIHDFKAHVPGLDVTLGGSAADLLGSNPRYRVNAGADAQVRPLLRFVPASLGIKDADGDVHLELKADVTQQAITTYQFQKADVTGSLRSDRLQVSIPLDSIDARLFRTRIRLGSNQSGLQVGADFDSLYLDKGIELQARVRKMHNSAQISKVAVQDRMVPRLYVASDNGQLFAKIGSSRMGVDDVNVWLAAQQRVRRGSDRRKRQLDSLQALYPDTPRADLAAQLAERELNRPPRAHHDFADSDLAISLDESVAKLLREWSPSGSIAAGEGFFASPQMPLRTRLTVLRAGFDDNAIDLDSLGVVSGSSDVLAAGYVSGIHGALFRHGVLEANLNVDSRRINTNEIIAALQLGTEDLGKVDPADEQDESFVTDTLENAVIDPDKMSLVVVPGNIKATLGIQIDTVDYTDLRLGPVITVARIQDRTAQILGTHVISDMGRIALDAYYSTQSKQDISAGVNLSLVDMDAHDIIHMLPTVDDMMPALKSFEGKLGCELSATTQLDTNMNVVIPSLDGLIRITGHDLEVKDAGDLRRITRLLLFRNKNIGHIDDLSVDAVIHNSQVEVFPFQLGVDRYRIALRGTQGFDKSMYYHASILRSPFLIRFGINLYGTLDNWRFSLGRARYKEGRVPVFTEQLDTVQFNIARGIRNIFDSGIKHVNAYNMEQERLRVVQEDDDDEPLTAEEQQEIDDYALAIELEEQQAALDAEVNEAIAAATLDTEKLMQQYAEQIYDKRILRKMEKLKNKEKKS